MVLAIPFRKSPHVQVTSVSPVGVIVRFPSSKPDRTVKPRLARPCLRRTIQCKPSIRCKSACKFPRERISQLQCPTYRCQHDYTTDNELKHFYHLFVSERRASEIGPTAEVAGCLTAHICQMTGKCRRTSASSITGIVVIFKWTHRIK